MSHVEHKELSPQVVSCAVLIISDSRTEATDESGKLLMENDIERINCTYN